MWNEGVHVIKHRIPIVKDRPMASTSIILLPLQKMRKKNQLYIRHFKSTILKRSDERKHPCLIFDLSRKASTFSPLSMMLAVSVL